MENVIHWELCKQLKVSADHSESKRKQKAGKMPKLCLRVEFSHQSSLYILHETKCLQCTRTLLTIFTVILSSKWLQFIFWILNTFHLPFFCRTLQLSFKCTNAIGLMRRVFANSPGDQGSIPGRVIPKTQIMVLDAAWFNTQHYKVRV